MPEHDRLNLKAHWRFFVQNGFGCHAFLKKLNYICCEREIPW